MARAHARSKAWSERNSTSLSKSLHWKDKQIVGLHGSLTRLKSNQRFGAISRKLTKLQSQNLLLQLATWLRWRRFRSNINNKNAPAFSNVELESTQPELTPRHQVIYGKLKSPNERNPQKRNEPRATLFVGPLSTAAEYCKQLYPSNIVFYW